MASDGTYFDTDCVLMLHMDGADTSTSFTDVSDSAHTVTANGNAQVDTGNKKWGTGSLLLDGSAYLAITGSLSDFDFGTGPFTIDFQAYFDSANAWDTFWAASDETSMFLAVDDNNSFYTVLGNQLRQNAWTKSADTWYHIAIVREAGGVNNYNIYVNGTAVGAVDASSAEDCVEPTVVRLGLKVANSLGFNGAIDEFRVCNTAVWTGAFTPPSAAYLPSPTAGSITTRRVFMIT